MGDQTVGFSFQADVVNTASLAHLLTGRVLKAISDGGVDFYSVAASIWLGKQIPIQASLESSIHQLIIARSRQRNTFLAKALSIGWGHSQIPCEMSRTKAGTSALVLIGALTTGSTYFMAAQVMSELLSLSGCEPDQVPNVDVLKTLAAYLAPFMENSGFPKIFQHITTTCKHQLAQAGSKAPVSLSATGNAPLIAGIIKQLCMTSQAQETLYLIPNQRVAWVAAFACHVLGMSVKVCMRDSTLWACAGTKGEVILQLSSSYVESLALESRLRPIFRLVNAPTGQDESRSLNVDYSTSEALLAECGNLMLADDTFVGPVQQAIARKCFSIHKNLLITKKNEGRLSVKVPGLFQGVGALRETLRAFGISDLVIGGAEKDHSLLSITSDEWVSFYGLCFLSQEVIDRICPNCTSREQGNFTRFLCRCSKVDSMIDAMAWSIIALAECSCNLSELKLRANFLNGTERTTWTGLGKYFGANTNFKKEALYSYAMGHVAHLLFPLDVDVHKGAPYTTEAGVIHNTLGLSGGSFTICYSAILDTAAFSDYGQFLSILSGRASVGGIVRKSIEEVSEGIHHTKPEYTALSVLRASLSVGSYIEPHYYPGKLQVFMEASVAAEILVIETSIGENTYDARKITLLPCIEELRMSTIVPICNHPVNEAWRVPPGSKPSKYVISSFSPYPPDESDYKGTLIYALKGDRLQQIIQCRLLSNRPVSRLVLQLHCCLKCAFSVAGGSRDIIIGG